MDISAEHWVDEWAGKRVLITGVCGTIGRALLRQISALNVSEIVGIDNNETELFFLEEAFGNRSGLQLCLGDVRDQDKLARKASGTDVILHCAGLKHVPACEKEPTDAIATNILGTQNVIDAASAANVGRVIFTSSDKAVNPTNVMGTSKLMGERLMTAANAHGREGRSIYASTRFGNVLGSRGSVIPLFTQQILSGGPVTLTDERMTRFIMTVDEAAQLVMNSVFLAKGGEVFVTKMRAIVIRELVEVMIEELAPTVGLRPEDIEIKVIGSKPGEKLYEELMNDEETRRTLELPDYFVVVPAFKSLYQETDYSYPGGRTCGPVSSPYVSERQPLVPKEELRAYLRERDLIVQSSSSAGPR